MENRQHPRLLAQDDSYVQYSPSLTSLKRKVATDLNTWTSIWLKTRKPVGRA